LAPACTKSSAIKVKKAKNGDIWKPLADILDMPRSQATKVSVKNIGRVAKKYFFMCIKKSNAKK